MRMKIYRIQHATATKKYLSCGHKNFTLCLQLKSRKKNIASPFLSQNHNKKFNDLEIREILGARVYVLTWSHQQRNNSKQFSLGGSFHQSFCFHWVWFHFLLRRAPKRLRNAEKQEIKETTLSHHIFHLLKDKNWSQFSRSDHLGNFNKISFKTF